MKWSKPLLQMLLLLNYTDKVHAIIATCVRPEACKQKRVEVSLSPVAYLMYARSSVMINDRPCPCYVKVGILEADHNKYVTLCHDNLRPPFLYCKGPILYLVFSS